MISLLSGVLFEQNPESITFLTSGGVGYEVFPSLFLLSQLSLGKERTIVIHHHITESGQALFGFQSAEERTIFRRLLKISGVGGKTALSLINLGVSQLVTAIEQNDEKFISQAQGVGKKMALKIIIELKKAVDSKTLFVPTGEVPLAPNYHYELIDTLVGMGYDRKSVEGVLANIPEELSSLQEKTIFAIKSLSNR